MYKKLAQEYEIQDNVTDALFYYEKCILVAQKNEHNDEEEAEISYKIGNLLFSKF